ncbi:MAG: hypothetical protein GY863_08685 [bacterium]|nr:hypothetical protein [bacterium]
MKRIACIFCLIILILPLSGFAQTYLNSDGRVKVVIIKDPYSDSRSGPEIVRGPDIFETMGIRDLINRTGCTIEAISTVKMPPELESQYGEWNRAAYTNKALSETISDYNKDDCLFIGLLSGSKSVIGMLAGLQHLGPDRKPLRDSRNREIKGLPRLGENSPLKVGLIWIDSRAAFDTPDITLEGEMERMNVAVAAGLCNTNLRIQAGLDPPLSTKYIVMAGIRNLNPYEDVHIDNTFIERISTEELKSLSENIDTQIERLSKLTDVIYVHVDMSVLDPAEIPGHPNAYPGGPTSMELAACLKKIFSFNKVAAIGLASMHDDPEQISLDAAERLLESAIQGVTNRR